MGAEAALIAMGGATALQAFGALKQGRDEAAVAGYNADVAKLQGQAAVQEASSQEQIKRGEFRRFAARQRLIASSNGMGPGGTTEDIEVDSARAAELDALAIRMGGALAKQRAQAQAALYKEQGRQVKIGSTLSALTLGLSGGANTYLWSQKIGSTGGTTPTSITGGWGDDTLNFGPG